MSRTQADLIPSDASTQTKAVLMAIFAIYSDMGQTVFPILFGAMTEHFGIASGTFLAFICGMLGFFRFWALPSKYEQ